MSRLWIQIISALEVAGGICGIGLVLWEFPSMPLSFYTVTLTLIATVIYIFSLIAGITLWLELSLGRIFSIIIQIIELPKIVSPLLTFTFSFGFDFYVYWAQAQEFSNLRINFKFLAFHQILVNVPEAPIGLGVSIPAIIFLIKLFRYKQHELKEIDDSIDASD